MTIKEQLNTQIIDVDLLNDIYIPVSKLKSKDIKTRSRKFRFFSSGSLLNLENITVRAFVVNAEKKQSFVDLVKLSDNVAELIFTSNMLSTEGILNVEIVLYSAEGEEISSFIITFNVIESLRDTKAVEGMDEFNSLQIALKDVEKVKSSFQDLYDNKESELNNLKAEKEEALNNTNRNWNSKFEAKYNNLNAEYAQVISELKTNTTNNENEINKIKTDVDNNKLIINSMNAVAQEWNSFKTLDVDLRGTNGYQKLPSGLILQWGTSNIQDVAPGTAQVELDIPLPIAFPSQILYCGSGNVQNSNAWTDLVSNTVAINRTKIKLMCKHWSSNLASGNLRWYWFAVGR